MTEEQLARIFGDLTVVQLILWALAAGISLALVVKLWPTIKRFIATVDALAELPAKLPKIDKLEHQVEAIHHETRDNHGSSLKDSARRTESKVIELSNQLTDLKARLEGHLAWSDEWSRGIEDTLNPQKENPHDHRHP